MVQSMTAPDFSRYCRRPCEFQIGIASHDRSTEVCEGALRMLSSQGISLRSVTIFVAEGEMLQYRRALQAHDYLDVKVRRGGVGLNENMRCMYAHYTSGTHLVSLTDNVSDLMWLRGGVRRSAPSGMLRAVVAHAWDLMLREGAYFWGLNVGSSTMNPDTISRKFGLVNANFCGHRVSRTRSHLFEHDYPGVVWDLEHSILTWVKDGVLLRYGMLAVQHQYGAPGGLYMDAKRRRRMENSAIKSLAEDYPSLLHFVRKVAMKDANASRVQNYEEARHFELRGV